MFLGLFVSWEIWKERNLRIFEGKQKSCIDAVQGTLFF